MVFFYSLLKPKLEQLKEPIYECFTNVYSYLEMLSTKILERTFSKYPKIISTISEFVNIFLIEEKNQAKALIYSIIDMDINHLFTNDYKYMTNWTTNKPKGRKTNNQIFMKEKVFSSEN